MSSMIAAALGLMLLAMPAIAQDQPAPQRGGCASGFCSTANAPAQQTAEETDIDAVDADMKRQLAGQAKPRQQMAGQMGGQMGGMMGMCPCMRMMSMMMQGRGMQGMPGMDMKGMDMKGMTMPDMSPMPEKAPPAAQ